MMRLQEEAQPEEEEDLFNFDQNDNLGGNNDGGPRNAGGVGGDPFEPQFEPLDPAAQVNDDQIMSRCYWT